jgi:hypothetical protein
MKKCLLAVALLLLSGCVVGSNRPIKTEIVTYPRGGVVEVDGKQMGTEPVTITLPQNEKGHLTSKVEIRAMPEDERLYAQTKIFDPADPARKGQVPSRVLLDLSASPDGEDRVDVREIQQEQKAARKEQRLKEERGKPTRPVGGY